MKFYTKLENNIVKDVKGFADSDVVGEDWKYIDYEKQNIPVGIGFVYDEQNGVYIYPKPFDSWIMNSNFMWEAPVRYPDTSENTNSYNWDESTLSWVISASILNIE